MAVGEQVADLDTVRMASDNETCVEWTYEDGRLHFTHQNAALNCEPEPELRIDVEDQIILVSEEEKSCTGKRLCLTNMEGTLDDLPIEVYTLVFDEPFRDPNDAKLKGAIDLRSQTSGSFCVERTRYPWESNTTSGVTLRNRGCNGGKPHDPFREQDPTCIEYSYDSAEQLLWLRHVNTVFICCPKRLYGTFRIVDSLIILREWEVIDLIPCPCMCSVDIEFVVAHLPAGEYTLVVHPRHSTTNYRVPPPLNVALDLTASVDHESICMDARQPEVADSISR